MRARRVWTLVAIVIVAIAAGLGVRAMRGSAPPAPAVVAPARDDAGTVKFLMEQQWAIRMKLARATPAAVAAQITATGRVVPAPGRHVVVSPPVPGILTGTTFPRVGQAVDMAEESNEPRGAGPPCGATRRRGRGPR